MDKFSNFVPNVHFEKIPIKNLLSNQEYQRKNDLLLHHAFPPILIIISMPICCGSTLA